MSKNPNIRNLNPYDLVEIKRVANSANFSNSFHFDPKNSVIIRFDSIKEPKNGNYGKDMQNNLKEKGK